MKRRYGVALAGVAAGLAAAAALHRATHPSDAGPGPTSDPPRPRLPVPDHLFDLPGDVTHHELAARDGGTIHAIERGEGPPVVLLHGITLRSDVWAPQFHQLSDRFRVIAVDLRGHGRSRPGAEGYGIGVLAADLDALLHGLDLRHAVVVGHSMGGMTAMAFAGSHPETLADRVSGLVFVATRAHQVLPPQLDRAARLLVAQGQGRLDRGLPLPRRASVNERAARLAFGDRPSPRAVTIVAEMGQSMEPAALVPSLAGLFEHDARDALAATHTPSLVVVGTRDLLTPVPAGRHLAHLLPDSQFVVLRRAGHQLMQERPDELSRLVAEFAVRVHG